MSSFGNLLQTVAGALDAIKDASESAFNQFADDLEAF